MGRFVRGVVLNHKCDPMAAELIELMFLGSGHRPFSRIIKVWSFFGSFHIAVILFVLSRLSKMFKMHLNLLDTTEWAIRREKI